MAPFALITGASKGIGLSIARSLATRGYNLLLVARSGDVLGKIKADLEKANQVRVEYLAADLSQTGAAARVFSWCVDEGFPVSVLVNNAGYGVWGRFDKSSIDDQLNMLQLNMNTLVELTYRFLPLLRDSKPSYILNIASTAAYQALPTFSAYAASKAFVLSFSRGLRFELATEGISVTCVSPGPVDTEFVNRAGLTALAATAAKFNMMPDVVGEIAVRAMLAGKDEVIPGFANKISAFAARLLPKSLLERIGAGLYKNAG